MAAEENHKAAAASAAAAVAGGGVLFNEDDDSSSEEEEEAFDDEEPLTLIPKPQQPTPRSSAPPLFDEDEDEEEEEEEESAGLVTFAVAGNPQASSAAIANPKIEEPSPITPGEKKPSALDESRKLFQRLWTDEDEIELLQGFLDYTTARGTSQHHHHETALFYDQIKGKFQLEFNKNQLVEKLRRLKKKYRNVVNRINSGKDFAFKSPHDQATFEISRKIWSNDCRVPSFEEDDANPSPNPNPNPNPNPSPNPVAYYHSNDAMMDGNGNSLEKKAPRSRKRCRGKSQEKPTVPNNAQLGNSIPSLVEETVRSCLSPLFKELLQSAMNGPSGSRVLGGVAALNPMPLSFGGPSMMNLSREDMVDEKWRKQQILELEVYAKRLELVQDQIKSVLEELRSMGS